MSTFRGIYTKVVSIHVSKLCEVGEDSQLRTIQLRGSAVSYKSLKSLVKSCAKLKSIDLQSCRGLPRGIKRCYLEQEFINLRNEIIEGKYD
jgi:F-box/leucine-rich repeat protein 6